MPKTPKDVQRLQEAIANKAIWVVSDGTVLVPRDGELLHSVSSALGKPELGGHPMFPELLRYSVSEKCGDPRALVGQEQQIQAM